MPSTVFIDANTLPRRKTAQGEVVEILNNELAGAKNVLGMLHWLQSGESYTAAAEGKHQLLYVMEGAGSILLENQNHDVTKGMGVYLGPSESATIRAGGGVIKLFHLVVPQIPK